MKYLFIGLIKLYKATLDKIMPHTCIYFPTCSSYTLLSIKSFGAVYGLFLGIKRLLRCVPWQSGGLDGVPPNIKKDYKWLI